MGEYSPSGSFNDQKIAELYDGYTAPVADPADTRLNMRTNVAFADRVERERRAFLEQIRLPGDDTDQTPNVTSFDIPEGVLGIRGILKTLTPSGRAERAEARANQLRKTNSVVRYVAESIDNPKNWQIPMGTVSGWYGYHKDYIGGKKGHVTYPKRPNIYRPTTKTEQRTADRLELIAEKLNTISSIRDNLLRNSNLDIDSDGYVLTPDASSRPLSYSEQKNLKKYSRKVNKASKKMNRLTNKFEKIAGSTDLRGKIRRKRIERATKPTNT